jgi:hypothetical protein
VKSSRLVFSSLATSLFLAGVCNLNANAQSVTDWKVQSHPFPGVVHDKGLTIVIPKACEDTFGSPCRAVRTFR